MALAAAGVLSLSSCNGFLDTKPNDIMTQDQVYADPALVKSVLANFYACTGAYHDVPMGPLQHPGAERDTFIGLSKESSEIGISGT